MSLKKPSVPPCVRAERVLCRAFRARRPPLSWAPLPPEWITGVGTVGLVIRKGTLVPLGLSNGASKVGADSPSSLVPPQASAHVSSIVNGRHAPPDVRPHAQPQADNNCTRAVMALASPQQLSPILSGSAPNSHRRGTRFSCWAAELRGTDDECTPDFKPGNAHFKTKICPCCRASAIHVPVERVRALTPALQPRVRAEAGEHGCAGTGWNRQGRGERRWG